MHRRDDLVYHDNDFEVFIDPDGDTHEYYEFETNVYGTALDLLLVKPYRDGGSFVSAWDIAAMETAVQAWGTVNDPRDVEEGWSVELAFPWSVPSACANRAVPRPTVISGASICAVCSVADRTGARRRGICQGQRR